MDRNTRYTPNAVFHDSGILDGIKKDLINMASPDATYDPFARGPFPGRGAHYRGA
jgi:hypothetical protein